MINLDKNIRSKGIDKGFLNPYLVLSLLIVLAAGCKHKNKMYQSPPGYNFSVYDKKNLETDLREISGITWDRVRNIFLAIQDESGKLYMLDRESKKNIIPPLTFAGKGDYEDLAVIDTTAYVLRSDGTIIKCHNEGDGVTGAEIGKLELQGPNDFESMYYDPNRKALVIICKNCASDKDDLVSAYAYYPERGGFDNKPLFQIDRKAVEKLTPMNKGKFQPSAAAINPRQQRLYILSSASKELAVTDLDGKVEAVYGLIGSIFPQAEGIAFRTNGDMYITNEGPTGKPTMLRFLYTEKKAEVKVGVRGYYDFSKPDDKMELGNHLKEISGMVWLPDQQAILAHNDEKGDMFIVDFENKNDQVKKIRFGGKEDYEDIVHTDTADYLLISTGTILRITYNDTAVTSTEEFKLGIKPNSEFEAMYRDPVTHALILLCKECAGEKDKIRTAYSFDPVKKQFGGVSQYTIDISAIQTLLNDPKAEFKPSAAAINPANGKLFIVASVGKLLVIADRNGKVEQVIRLDPILFNQPEGMTFAPNGDLYISNEAGEVKATILKFRYKQ
jgi:uncharacterized protein YjiK